MIVTEFGLVDISRQYGAKFVRKYGFDENIEQILSHSLPYGQPAPECIKYVHFNDKSYLTYMQVLEEDYGRALIINIPQSLETKFNPIDYVEPMKNFVNENDGNGVDTEPQLILDPKKTNVTSYSLENIDTAIYSLLTKQKSYSVGSHDEILELINIMLEVLPSNMVQKFDFTSQTNSLSENTAFSGLPLTYENLEHLDALRNEKNAVIFFPNKTCYGNYSSPFTKVLSGLFQRGNFSEAKTLLDRFINQAVEESDTIIDPITTAQKYKLKVPDAILLLQIRGILYNKVIPPKTFDKLVA